MKLKPMYSFGKWWKWKISLMGFVYRVVFCLKPSIFWEKCIKLTVLWHQEWDCCTFWKIYGNLFKSAKTMALNSIRLTSMNGTMHKTIWIIKLESIAQVHTWQIQTDKLTHTTYICDTHTQTHITLKTHTCMSSTLLQNFCSICRNCHISCSH